MPALPKTGGQTLFLGIELGVDQLRASIVDESLELVGVECVDFDSELPEYQCVSSLLPPPACTMGLTKIDTPFSLGLRAAYSPHPVRHTRPQLRCGSKALVSPVLPFFPLLRFFPRGTNFFFSFWIHLIIRLIWQPPYVPDRLHGHVIQMLSLKNFTAITT